MKSFRQSVRACICCVNASTLWLSAVDDSTARGEAGLTVARRLGASGWWTVDAENGAACPLGSALRSQPAIAIAAMVCAAANGALRM